MIVLSRRDDKCVHVTRVSDFDGFNSARVSKDTLMCCTKCRTVPIARFVALLDAQNFLRILQ